jgi:hypothetical protein
MIKKFKMFESSNKSILIGLTPITDNEEDDIVWLYKKILYYKGAFEEYRLCQVEEYDTDEENCILRDGKKLYYDPSSQRLFMNWLIYPKYYIQHALIGKTKDDVENKIDEYYITLATKKFNL